MIVKIELRGDCVKARDITVQNFDHWTVVDIYFEPAEIDIYFEPAEPDTEKSESFGLSLTRDAAEKLMMALDLLLGDND